MGYCNSRRRRHRHRYHQQRRHCHCKDDSTITTDTDWHNQTIHHNLQCIQVYRPQPWIQALCFIRLILFCILQYIVCFTYGITYVTFATTSSVILPIILAYITLALAIATIFYISYYVSRMIVYLEQEALYKVNEKWTSLFFLQSAALDVIAIDAYISKRGVYV